MKRQRGLSLIEMMISLMLSTFLILAVTQLYLGNKRHYLYQEGQVENGDNGRLALLLLDQQLAKAGFRANPVVKTTLTEAFPSLDGTNGCPAFAAGQTIQLTTDANQSGICFRYQGAAKGTDVDCLGNKIAAATHGTEVLTRISYVADGSGTGTLRCSAQGQAAQVLVSGLTSFVWFKVPSSADSNQAIRYAALFSTTKDLTDGISSTVINNWNTLSGQSLQDSTHVLQIVQGSVTLRNLMQ
ncbi:hypothetical protein AX284_03480 [Pseudomonas sp. HUK17]|nr:hypothetical protein AX284_03480 [Pseudomonas sp. HUK17]